MVFDIFKTIVPIDQLPVEEEAKLARDHSNGDAEAGNVLIRSQIRWIHNLCRSICKNSHVSEEEIIADVLLDVVEALPRYQPGEYRLITYLTPIITKTAGRYLQVHSDPVSGRRRPAKLTKEDVQEILGQHEAIEEDDWHESLDEVSIHLKEAVELATKTEVAKKVFDLRLQGMGACDIADQLGILPIKVKEVVANIAASVMNELQARGIDCIDFVSLKTINPLKPIAAQQRVFRALGLGIA